MPLEAYTYKGTVKSTKRMDRPGIRVCVVFDCETFELVEGKALEDRKGDVVVYRKGDRVGVTYDPLTRPQEVLGMRKLEGLEAQFDDGGSREFR